MPFPFDLVTPQDNARTGKGAGIVRLCPPDYERQAGTWTVRAMAARKPRRVRSTRHNSRARSSRKRSRASRK